MKIKTVPFAALGLALVHCSTDPCSRNSPCPNDPPQLPRDLCRAGLDMYQNEPCYSEKVALANCQLDNIVCTSDGHTNLVASAPRWQSACATQTGNVTACCQRNPHSGACP